MSPHWVDILAVSIFRSWFVSPWVLPFTTALVVVVTWRRQFASNAWRAMGGRSGKAGTGFPTRSRARQKVRN